jgi:hypothetical protein
MSTLPPFTSKNLAVTDATSVSGEQRMKLYMLQSTRARIANRVKRRL